MKKMKVYPDPEAVAQAAADYLFKQIKNCVAKKGLCHVVLPGGSTPARCLALLAELPLPWKNIHWYLGDERCYPLGHIERNDTMISAKLFSQHNSPLNSQDKQMSENFHRIPAELGPEKGALRYASVIAATGGMDIVVLGMGEDGHTASLFPDNISLKDQRSVVPVTNAPKPPAERISLGLNVLKNAGECIIIATGENKREALAEIRQGAILPAGLVQADTWFVDNAAAATKE